MLISKLSTPWSSSQTCHQHLSSPTSMVPDFRELFQPHSWLKHPIWPENDRFELLLSWNDLNLNWYHSSHYCGWKRLLCFWKHDLKQYKSEYVQKWHNLSRLVCNVCCVRMLYNVGSSRRSCFIWCRIINSSSFYCPLRYARVWIKLATWTWKYCSDICCDSRGRSI